MRKPCRFLFLCGPLNGEWLLVDPEISYVRIGVVPCYDFQNPREDVAGAAPALLQETTWRYQKRQVVMDGRPGRSIPVFVYGPVVAGDEWLDLVPVGVLNSLWLEKGV